MSIDWDKPIETVSGKPAKVISRDFKSKNRGFDVVVQFEEDCESRMGFYTQEGRPVCAGPLLRNKTKKVTKWINLYSSFPGSRYYDTSEAAKAVRDKAVRDGAEGWSAVAPVEIEVPCD